MNSRALPSFSDDEWEAIYKRLLAYVHRLLGFASESDRGIPLGRQAHDLVHGAIEAVFDGRRAWHADRDPYAQLAGMVRSELSNLRTSKGGQLEATAETGASEDDPSTIDPPSGEDLLAALIRSECQDVLRALMDQAAEGDGTIEDYCMGVEDGLTPAEIAEIFSIPIKRAYQARKDLLRKLRPLVKQHPCWANPDQP